MYSGFGDGFPFDDFGEDFGGFGGFGEIFQDSEVGEEGGWLGFGDDAGETFHDSLRRQDPDSDHFSNPDLGAFAASSSMSGGVYALNEL